MKRSDSMAEVEKQRDAQILRSKSFAPFGEISHRWGPTFEKWVEDSYRTHKLKTVQGVRDDIANFLRVVKERPIDNKSLSDYVNVIQDRNPVTAGRATVTVRKWVREQIEEGKMSPKLKAIVTISQQAPKMKDPMTFAEYQRLLETATTPELAWLYMLGYHTGMSCVDCAELRFSDVDFKKMVIHRKREKMLKRTGGNAIIPFQAGGELHTGLVQFQRRWAADPNKSDNDYVCRELAESSIRRLLTPRVNHHFNKLGIKGGFRKFRVAMAKSLNDGSSASLIDMMRIMGHRNPNTTQRYIPPNIDKLRKATIEAAQSRQEDGADITGDLGVEHENVPLSGGAIIPMNKEEFEPYSVWSHKERTGSGRVRHKLYVVSPKGAFYICDWAGMPRSLSIHPQFFRKSEIKQVQVTVKEKAMDRIKRLDVKHYGHEDSVSRIINFTSPDVPDTSEDREGRGGQAVNGH